VAQATTGGGINYLELMAKASLPVKIIVLLLLVGSFVSWVIIFRKARVFKQATREADEFENRFWSGADLGKLYSAATDRNRRWTAWKPSSKPVSANTPACATAALDGRAQLEGAQRAMRTYTREVDQLERNLELLANIGSTAPYVGLVGTVFGIMVTMHDMISSGEAGIAAVAPGIPEAVRHRHRPVRGDPGGVGLQPLHHPRRAHVGAL
jgi:biopolymer transport protein TolQ